MTGKTFDVLAAIAAIAFVLAVTIFALHEHRVETTCHAHGLVAHCHR